jgi:hypothetical protein
MNNFHVTIMRARDSWRDCERAVSHVPHRFARLTPSPFHVPIDAFITTAGAVLSVDHAPQWEHVQGAPFSRRVRHLPSRRRPFPTGRRHDQPMVQTIHRPHTPPGRLSAGTSAAHGAASSLATASPQLPASTPTISTDDTNNAKLELPAEPGAAFTATLAPSHPRQAESS